MQKKSSVVWMFSGQKVKVAPRECLFCAHDLELQGLIAKWPSSLFFNIMEHVLMFICSRVFQEDGRAPYSAHRGFCLM